MSHYFPGVVEMVGQPKKDVVGKMSVSAVAGKFYSSCPFSEKLLDTLPLGFQTPCFWRYDWTPITHRSNTVKTSGGMTGRLGYFQLPPTSGPRCL